MESLFEQQWQTYRTVLEHDAMEHRAAANAAASALHLWMAERPGHKPPPTLIDLGCGDLARMADVFRALPLSAYTGLDLAASVLPLAARAMGEAPFPCTWQQGDLLSWAVRPDSPAEDNKPERVDVIHSAFAIHHLSESQKIQFLRGALQRIEPDGLLLWVDVFQNADDTRDTYLDRYIDRVRRWPGLNALQIQAIVEHMQQCDWPARRGSIETIATEEGWRWHWGWRGSHGSEALAVLRPSLSRAP